MFRITFFSNKHCLNLFGNTVLKFLAPRTKIEVDCAIPLYSSRNLFFAGLIILAFTLTLGNKNYAAAQLPAQPASLVPRHSAVFVESNNLPSLIDGLYRYWYQPFYEKSKKEGLISTLEIPLPQNSRYGTFEGTRHWITDCFSVYRHESGLLGEIYRNYMMADNGSESSGDALIKEIGRMFSGKAFLAITQLGVKHTIWFGFEYDPKILDWWTILRAEALSAEAKNAPLRKVEDLEVIHFANESLFIFEHNSVLYGVYSNSEADCAEFARRVLNPEATSETSLQSSRHFQRVAQSAKGLFPQQAELFLFSDIDRIESIAKRIDGGQGSEKQQDGRRLDAEFDKGQLEKWGNSLGFVLHFSDETLQYGVCRPLLLPHQTFFQNMMAYLQPLDFDRERQLPSGASWAIYTNHGGRDGFLGNLFGSEELANELSLDYWKGISANSFETFDVSIVVSLAVTQALGGVRCTDGEVCRFFSVLHGKTKNGFLAKKQIYEVDILRGAYAPLDAIVIEEETVDEAIVEWIQSRTVPIGNDRLAKSEDATPSGNEPLIKGTLENMKIDQADPNVSAKTYGNTEALLSVITMDGGVYVCAHKCYLRLLKTSEILEILRGSRSIAFDPSVFIPKRVCDEGHLAGICVKRNFTSFDTKWNAVDPVLGAIGQIEKNSKTSYNFGVHITGDSLLRGAEDGNANEYSLLTRLFRGPLSILDPRLATCKHLLITPITNSDTIWVECLVYLPGVESVNYIGVITNDCAKLSNAK